MIRWIGKNSLAGSHQKKSSVLMIHHRRIDQLPRSHKQWLELRVPLQMAVFVTQTRGGRQTKHRPTTQYFTTKLPIPTPRLHTTTTHRGNTVDRLIARPRITPLLQLHSVHPLAQITLRTRMLVKRERERPERLWQIRRGGILLTHLRNMCLLRSHRSRPRTSMSR